VLDAQVGISPSASVKRALEVIAKA
jgi:hypothetical protein